MPLSTRATRRDALKLAGGVAAGDLTGFESFGRGRDQGSGQRRTLFNVGYYGRSGRRTTRSMADRTVREFDFGAATIEATPERADRLRRMPSVKYVEPDWRVTPLGKPMNYGIDRTDADVAHERGATGDGVHVAVIDTGIAPEHEALRPNLGVGTDVIDRESRFGATHWRDPNGHGTHCAGLIGATGDGNGVCTDATLHAVRAIRADGTGRVSDAAAGLEYVRRQGWEVANLSFGTRWSELLVDACRAAWGDGTTLVAAAGGPGTDCPSRDPACLAVGAVGPDDERTAFSPTTGIVDVVAPGADIRSTVPSGYEERSGTSMAAALVTGAVASLIARDYRGMEARQRVRDTASDIGLDPEEQGDGLLDVAAALGYPSSDDLADPDAV